MPWVGKTTWIKPDDHELAGAPFAVMGEPTDGDTAVAYLCWNRSVEDGTELWAQAYSVVRSSGSFTIEGDPSHLFDMPVNKRAKLHERSSSGVLIFSYDDGEIISG